ncbi:hypothetical protein CR513_49281, partial [Mucuna pruriens]
MRDVDVAYIILSSFKFILVLYIMEKITRITKCLFIKLYNNILRTYSMLCSYSILLNVYPKHIMSVLDIKKSYHNTTSFQNKQLHELNDNFSEKIMKLLILRYAFFPKDAYKAFNIEGMCILMYKFYPS